MDLDMDKKYNSTIKTGYNKKFVNDMIDSIYNISFNEQTQQSINIILLASNFNEPLLFSEIYAGYLEDRLHRLYYMLYIQYKYTDQYLLKIKSILKLEKSMVYRFKKPVCNMAISKMLNIISDIENAINNTLAYRQMNIQINNKKYKHVNIEELERKKFFFVPMRYNTWSMHKDSSDIPYNIPSEIGIYIDIMTAYFKKREPWKKLLWNFNIGFAVLNIKIGEVLYNFKVTIPQWCVLYQFNIKEKISPREIGTNLKIPIKVVGKILEGLLSSKLITHEKGALNNPDLLFLYNKHFNKNKKIKSTNINLTIASKNIRMKRRMKRITREFKVGRNYLTRARIVRCLKINREEWEKNIYKYVCTHLPFKPDHKMFDRELLESIKKEGIVEMDQVGELGRKFKYIPDEIYIKKIKMNKDRNSIFPADDIDETE
jgi:hypothetical protein